MLISAFLYAGRLVTSFPLLFPSFITSKVTAHKVACLLIALLTN